MPEAKVLNSKVTTRKKDIKKPEKKIISVADEDLKTFKDLQIHMEHPFFSLSKRPVNNEIRYENGDNWIEISPSSKGRATIYDKDLLVYIISQLRQKIRNGEEVTRHVEVSINDYFKHANKSNGGRAYKLIIAALDRLDGTRIKTNIVSDGKVNTEKYGWIDGYYIKRKDDKRDGRIESCVVSLSEKLFKPVSREKTTEILTVNPKIFRLTRPKEKRIYDIARKHIGRKMSWEIGIHKLAIKMGSNTDNLVVIKKELRRSIKSLIETHQQSGEFNFPDFVIEFDRPRDIVIFHQKKKWWSKNESEDSFTLPEFSPQTFEDAKLVCPDLDVYILKQDFDSWVFENIDKFDLNAKKLQKAFIGFCKKRQAGKKGQTSLL